MIMESSKLLIKKKVVFKPATKNATKGKVNFFDTTTTILPPTSTTQI